MNPDDGHVLPRQKLLDRLELVENLQNRTDRGFVEIEVGRRANLGMCHLDRVVVKPTEEFVDLIDGCSRWILILDEQLLEKSVRVRMKQQAKRGEAVPACPAGLLVVGLQGTRHVKVDHRPDLGLVHSHAKRIGRHHDLGLAAHESILRGGALLACQTRVIHHGLTSQLVAHESRDGLTPGPAGGVHDGGTAVLIKRTAQLLKFDLVATGLD